MHTLKDMTDVTVIWGKRGPAVICTSHSLQCLWAHTGWAHWVHMHRAWSGTRDMRRKTWTEGWPFFYRPTFRIILYGLEFAFRFTFLRSNSWLFIHTDELHLHLFIWQRLLLTNDVQSRLLFVREQVLEKDCELDKHRERPYKLITLKRYVFK